MKRINLLFISSILCILSSCTGMLDTIQPYLDEGETIYVGKLDSLKAFSGRNQIKIQGKMMYGVNQVKCIISYHNPVSLEQESKEFPVVRQEARETFEFTLTDLTEGQYDFSVVTYDPKGNQSIPTVVSCYAYGEQYQQLLSNRIMRSVTPEQVTINDQLQWVTKVVWNISRGDGIIGCNIEYEQENGSFKSLFVPVDETTTALNDFKAGGILRYNTEYKPDLTSMDIFTTEEKELILPEKSYVGLTKDLTSIYIKNAGYPFTGHDVSNNWGILDNWSWNDVIRTKNGAGGAGFATYGGGIVQFETTNWSQGTYENGKVWQTINLPEGKYEIRIEVANCHGGDHNIRFGVVKGTELPDNNSLPDAALSWFEFDNGGRTETVPAFTLNEPTTVTLGWVVSFFETQKNIEFKSIRLWSVAE